MKRPLTNLRRGLMALAFMGLLLVFSGRSIAPAANWLGTAAAAGILAGYLVILGASPGRLEQTVLSQAADIGLVAGFVFAGEILLEYLLLPADNTLFGKWEYSLVYLLYLIAAVLAVRRTHRVRDGATAAAGAAIVASLLWVVTLLTVFYLFHGTHRQELVLRAEGDYEDFARSGMTDFSAFILEDLMGATFFHLLLGPILAAVVGLGGGAWVEAFTAARPTPTDS